MICIIALVVFSILGIFSIGYRKLAAEAFDCVFRRVTFRPCQTGFDERMRAQILGKLLVHSPRAAKIVKNHFEALSWFFTIVMIWSLLVTGASIYNLAVYGNCNGPDGGNCIFTQKATPLNESCDCGVDIANCKADWRSCSGDCDCVRRVCSWS